MKILIDTQDEKQVNEFLEYVNNVTNAPVTKPVTKPVVEQPTELTFDVVKAMAVEYMRVHGSAKFREILTSEGVTSLTDATKEQVANIGEKL